MKNILISLVGLLLISACSTPDEISPYKSSIPPDRTVIISPPVVTTPERRSIFSRKPRTLMPTGKKVIMPPGGYVIFCMEHPKNKLFCSQPKDTK